MEMLLTKYKLNLMLLMHIKKKKNYPASFNPLTLTMQFLLVDDCFKGLIHSKHDIDAKITNLN